MGISIEISDEMWRKLVALRTIVDKFAGLDFDSDSKYIEFLLNLAIHKVLSDVLADADARLDVIKALFNRDPDTVAKTIADMFEEEREEDKRVEERREAVMHM